jgi:hypothetical protein
MAAIECVLASERPIELVRLRKGWWVAFGGSRQIDSPPLDPLRGPAAHPPAPSADPSATHGRGTPPPDDTHNRR